MKQNSEKKIMHAYFIDLKGNPVQKIAVGDTVRIRIKTNNMVGENIQYIVWEYDLFGDPDQIIFSTAFKVPADTLDTQTLTITPERFMLGIDNKILYDPDAKEQQYFIEIIPLGSKAKSRKFGLDDEAKRMKVENGKSPAAVERTEVEKEKDEECPRCNKVTVQELQKIFTDVKDSSDIEEIVTHFNNGAKYFGIDTCLKKAHFFAQVLKETGSSLTIKSPESMNYSTDALMDIGIVKELIG